MGSVTVTSSDSATFDASKYLTVRSNGASSCTIRPINKATIAVSPSANSVIELNVLSSIKFTITLPVATVNDVAVTLVAQSNIVASDFQTNGKRTFSGETLKSEIILTALDAVATGTMRLTLSGTDAAHYMAIPDYTVRFTYNQIIAAFPRSAMYVGEQDSLKLSFTPPPNSQLKVTLRFSTAGALEASYKTATSVASTFDVTTQNEDFVSIGLKAMSPSNVRIKIESSVASYKASGDIWVTVNAVKTFAVVPNILTLQGTAVKEFELRPNAAPDSAAQIHIVTADGAAALASFTPSPASISGAAPITIRAQLLSATTDGVSLVHYISSPSVEFGGNNGAVSLTIRAEPENSFTCVMQRIRAGTDIADLTIGLTYALSCTIQRHPVYVDASVKLSHSQLTFSTTDSKLMWVKKGTGSLTINVDVTVHGTETSNPTPIIFSELIYMRMAGGAPMVQLHGKITITMTAPASGMVGETVQLDVRPSRGVWGDTTLTLKPNTAGIVDTSQIKHILSDGKTITVTYPLTLTGGGTLVLQPILSGPHIAEIMTPSPITIISKKNIVEVTPSSITAYPNTNIEITVNCKRLPPPGKVFQVRLDCYGNIHTPSWASTSVATTFTFTATILEPAQDISITIVSYSEGYSVPASIPITIQAKKKLLISSRMTPDVILFYGGATQELTFTASAGADASTAVSVTLPDAPYVEFSPRTFEVTSTATTFQVLATAKTSTSATYDKALTFLGDVAQFDTTARLKLYVDVPKTVSCTFPRSSSKLIVLGFQYTLTCTLSPDVPKYGTAVVTPTLASVAFSDTLKWLTTETALIRTATVTGTAVTSSAESVVFGLALIERALSPLSLRVINKCRVKVDRPKTSTTSIFVGETLTFSYTPSCGPLSQLDGTVTGIAASHGSVSPSMVTWNGDTDIAKHSVTLQAKTAMSKVSVTLPVSGDSVGEFKASESFDLEIKHNVITTSATRVKLYELETVSITLDCVRVPAEATSDLTLTTQSSDTSKVTVDVPSVTWRVGAPPTSTIKLTMVSSGTATINFAVTSYGDGYTAPGPISVTVLKLKVISLTPDMTPKIIVF
eukprot:PhM_4_TR13948/c2_g1_i1/m.88090